jgi:sulfur relay (sulfurtransferase) DsrF/TusC family protein
MKNKKILMFINESPLSDVTIQEGLRTALGTTAGYREHKVDVVLTGDSVYFMNIPEDGNSVKKFIEGTKLIGINIYLDEKSLEERNLDKEKVPEPFMTADRKKIFDLLKSADVNFSL